MTVWITIVSVLARCISQLVKLSNVLSPVRTLCSLNYSYVENPACLWVFSAALKVYLWYKSDSWMSCGREMKVSMSFSIQHTVTLFCSENEWKKGPMNLAQTLFDSISSFYSVTSYSICGSIPVSLLNQEIQKYFRDYLMFVENSRPVAHFQTWNKATDVLKNSHGLI